MKAQYTVPRQNVVTKRLKDGPASVVYWLNIDP